MDILARLKDFVKGRCNDTLTMSWDVDAVRRLVSDDFKTNRGNNADFYCFDDFLRQSVAKTKNQDHGVIGEPNNMLAYARLQDGVYIVVFNSPSIGEGYYIVDRNNDSCAASPETRVNGALIQGILNATEPDSKEVITSYIKGLGVTSGITEYLRLMTLAGHNPHLLGMKMLSYAINEDKDAADAVAKLILNDLK